MIRPRTWFRQRAQTHGHVSLFQVSHPIRKIVHDFNFTWLPVKYSFFLKRFCESYRGSRVKLHLATFSKKFSHTQVLKTQGNQFHCISEASSIGWFKKKIIEFVKSQNQLTTLVRPENSRCLTSWMLASLTGHTGSLRSEIWGNSNTATPPAGHSRH